MEANGASTPEERAGQLRWIADHLWSDTPHGAVHRAVEAQPQPVWLQLWHRALADGALRPGPSCALADTSEQGASSKGKESAVIVAAFVLSIPYLECPCAEEGGAVKSGAKAAMRRYVCVSLGSGSRCLAAHDAPPSDAGERVRRLLELRDGHAEVMARRGFIAFLLGIAEASARCSDRAYADLFLRRRSGDCDAATAVGASGSPQWELRETAALHLVCTRWMCGSLAAVAGGSGRSGHLLLRAACGCWLNPTMQSEASAKEADCASPTVTYVDRHALAAHYSPLNGAAPLLHAARVKPGKGRANLSMSCTDKVWRWHALGVQGRRRAPIFPVPMRLSSIHVLHPPFKDLGDLQAAADNAAATFQWRSRRCWLHKDSDATLPSTPKFAFFSSADFAATSPLAAAKLRDAGASIDSNYSRSRWLCVRSVVASRKRGRDEEAEAPALGSATCSWQCFRSGGDHDCSLVLNTKAGLPQGMTGRVLARRCSTSPEIPWQQCPLSRPWMHHRVRQLQASLTEIALISASMKASAAPASYAMAAIGERDAQTIIADAENLSMSQRVHRHHLQPLGTGDDSIRLLWASSSHMDGADLRLRATENFEGSP
ncbi:adenosine deaminase-like protein [Leishmania donovani]|uniref:tRNA-specific adenosine deaminase 1 n=3 Tax=Leishmania donovani species complex TaxID=38574 RepID=A0A6L0XMD4_LEIIN|nr:adenosine deaminase-like protein [Leishmania infantum JPCM5]CAC9529625.1 adenosine_deaminase-like_protein [Leishmania infantum]CAJ1991982.1 adenosine deaminase-like protein [Leishmania donovani]CAM71188.1 adenosine deaminase-like protein [Leishmania infantum JPCM5]SUZ45012.1 adenosine_deaminase-like_protein [Leishmania infantum]VDZ47819.1 adenosine_deaminase-like_protein/GeneDB:LmjF.33.0235 [Leishmania donovani]|eukprot:XP_001468110.1 adenosine deaminase-like protein [Leishmania infantum JPCM5]